MSNSEENKPLLSVKVPHGSSLIKEKWYFSVSYLFSTIILIVTLWTVVAVSKIESFYNLLKDKIWLVAVFSLVLVVIEIVVQLPKERYRRGVFQVILFIPFVLLHALVFATLYAATDSTLILATIYNCIITGLIQQILIPHWNQHFFFIDFSAGEIDPPLLIHAIALLNSSFFVWIYVGGFLRC